MRIKQSNIDSRGNVYFTELDSTLLDQGIDFVQNIKTRLDNINDNLLLVSGAINKINNNIKNLDTRLKTVESGLSII